MILVDLNQVLISNLMAQTRGKNDVKPNKEMVRHMVLNSIRGFNLKFKEEFGQQILCSDAEFPWRRKVFPHYKHTRRANREKSGQDWDNIFKLIMDIKEEIAENLPYMVLSVDNAEADDIIATLVKQQKEDKYIIISGDKDFIQLQKFDGVYQYSPILKRFIGEDMDAEEFLHQQIIKGDRSDGIPNILSPSDIFTTKEKQRPINKKRLEEWSKLDDIPLGSETRQYYQRNKQLIDFTEIPKEIENQVINRYASYKVPNRSKLLPYFINYKLKSMMTNNNDF